MSITAEPTADRHRQAHELRLPRRRRGRRDAQRGARRHGRQARLLPRPRGARADARRRSCAERTQTAEPYAREWLNAQAAGGYVTYDPATKRYTLPAEHALAMTDPDSPAFLPGFFQIALGTVHDTQHIVDAARSGAGYGWHQHDTDVHVGCERFFRPSYHANLIDSWIPALDGVQAEAREGRARRRRRLRARGIHDPARPGVPELDVRGLRLPRRVDRHREGARRRGGGRRTCGSRSRRRRSSAARRGYDLVAMFDCLHDMGDPVGAARHVREVIADDGTWMIVEPMAGDHVEDNLNPVGRAYYGFSTLLCTPVVALAGCRARARHAGGPGAHPRCHRRRRVHPVPQRRRDAVQPRDRSAALTAGG